jgi:hypothetical protein
LAELIDTTYRVADAFWVFADYGGLVGRNYWARQVDLGVGYSGGESRHLELVQNHGYRCFYT